MIHLMAYATIIICILFFPRSKEITPNPQLGWDHSHESSQLIQGIDMFGMLAGNVSDIPTGCQNLMAPRKRQRLSSSAIHAATSTDEASSSNFPQPEAPVANLDDDPTQGCERMVESAPDTEFVIVHSVRINGFWQRKKPSRLATLIWALRRRKNSQKLRSISEPVEEDDWTRKSVSRAMNNAAGLLSDGLLGFIAYALTRRLTGPEKRIQVPLSRVLSPRTPRRAFL